MANNQITKKIIWDPRTKKYVGPTIPDPIPSRAEVDRMVAEFGVRKVPEGISGMPVADQAERAFHAAPYEGYNPNSTAVLYGGGRRSRTAAQQDHRG